MRTPIKGLSDFIRSTPEYKRYTSAEARLKEDQAIHERVTKLNELSEYFSDEPDWDNDMDLEMLFDIEENITGDKNDTNQSVKEDQVVAEFDSFMNELEGNPLINEFFEARKQLSELLQKVFSDISAELSIDLFDLLSHQEE
ncbi:MAG: YlbF family regulator [Balneolales bacterium]|nr:YlbF family regulator [Balneolales bacterium]